MPSEQIQVNIRLIVHIITLNSRIDFAQPGHVLQVGAAVAKLKGVPLKKVI